MTFKTNNVLGSRDDEHRHECIELPLTTVVSFGKNIKLKQQQNLLTKWIKHVRKDIICCQYPFVKNKFFLH